MTDGVASDGRLCRDDDGGTMSRVVKMVNIVQIDTGER